MIKRLLSNNLLKRNASIVASLIRLHNLNGFYLACMPAILTMALINNFAYFTRIIALIFIARSVGCIINDYFDQDFDKQVARTKYRPIAAKAISTFAVFWIFLLLLILGVILFIPFLQYQQTFIITAAFIVIYPLLKRITFFPQVWLGITFSIVVWFIPLIHGIPFNYTHTLLFILCTLMVIYYDTVYALQDKRYDKKIGLKSITLLASTKTIKQALAVLLCLALITYFSIMILSSNFFLASIVTILISIWLFYTHNCYVITKQYAKGFNQAKFSLALMALGISLTHFINIFLKQNFC